jgi:hypothetical protein
MNSFERGFLVGFFVGQGSFGGDGKQPHIILRMHVQHSGLLDRLVKLIPGSKINGPYANGSKSYLQWSVRGIPMQNLVQSGVLEDLKDWDEDAYVRYRNMVDRYFVDGRLRSLKSRRMTSSSGGSSTESD